jgi:hypothetical protein
MHIVAVERGAAARIIATTMQNEADPYTRFLAEREEILRFKWLASEAVSRDVGFEHALTQWTSMHRESWRAHSTVARLSEAGTRG